MIHLFDSDQKPAKERIPRHYSDNAASHKGTLLMEKLGNLKYELFEHPPYSPDLGLSDRQLFLNRKKHLSGK